jgi:hypothetical protein
MQLPMIGSAIRIKNLVKILNQFDPNDLISVDLRKNLVILDPHNLYNSDDYIDLYSEEVKSYKSLKEMLEDESYRDTGNN